MSPGDERRLRPEDLVDLEVVAADLEAVEEHGRRDLQRRVRSAAALVGVDLEKAPGKALSLLLRAAKLDGDASPGRRLVRAYAWLRAGFLGFGLVFGALATTGVLVYDGTRPVNVLTFLFALVAPQLGLVLLFLVGLALGRRIESSLPFLGWLRQAVSELRRRLASRWGRSTEENRGVSDIPPVAEESLYAGIDRWRSVALLQWLAIGFNLGIIIAFSSRLALTDLVFGWSTTLGWVARAFPSFVEAVATPWTAWLPSALPDPSIVEATRFVRIGGGEVAWAGEAITPDLLLFSGWWPFLLASVIAYGLIPRVLVLALSNVMVHVRLRWALEQNRRLERLRSRMSAPLVEVVSEPDSAAEPPEVVDETAPGKTTAQTEPAPPASAEDLDLGPASLVLWGDVPDPKELLGRVLEARMGASVIERLRAGGLSFEETERSAKKLCEGRLARLPVVLVAEAFEAPVEELERFIQSIRRGGEGSRVVVVALVDVLEEDGWTEACPEDTSMWSKGLRRLPGVGAHLLGPVRLPPSGAPK